MRTTLCQYACRTPQMHSPDTRRTRVEYSHTHQLLARARACDGAPTRRVYLRKALRYMRISGHFDVELVGAQVRNCAANVMQIRWV